MDELLKISTVLAELRISRSTLQKIMDSGELRVYRVGNHGSLRIKRSDLTAFLRRRQVNAGSSKRLPSEPMPGNEYCPDRVTPPGETLQEILDNIGLSRTTLASRMGYPLETVNDLIDRHTRLFDETAKRLQAALKTPASFWITRERLYRESLAAKGSL